MHPWSGLPHIILISSSMVTSRGMMFQHHDHRVCGRPIAKVAVDASTCLRLSKLQTCTRYPTCLGVSVALGLNGFEGLDGV